MNYCASCGKPLEDGSRFCAACGAAVAAVEESPPAGQSPTRTKDFVFAILGLALSAMAFMLSATSLRFWDADAVGRALALNALIVPVPGFLFASLAKAVGMRAKVVRLFKTVAWIAAGLALLLAVVTLVGSAA